MTSVAYQQPKRQESLRAKRKRTHRHSLKLLLPPPPPARRALPRLIAIERRGNILRTSPLADVVESDVEGLNLMAGCPHQCSFCYALAYPGYSGQGNAAPALERTASGESPGTVGFYVHTAERLRRELRDRARRPAAVYLCPSTDPFPPYREVQEEACNVMGVLAGFGVETWFMTRGFIRPFALDRIAAQRALVRVTVPITTLDHGLTRTLEPLAAPPRLRLKQIEMLRMLRVRTQAAIDPLIPGLTDTRANLEPLVEALAQTGVGHLTAGYLFLRRGIRENMLRELGPQGLAEPILNPYATGPLLSMGNLAPANHLPRAERQRGYALLMALAAERGMTVTILRLTNPDFPAARGTTESASARVRQPLLPYGESSCRQGVLSAPADFR